MPKAYVGIDIEVDRGKLGNILYVVIAVFPSELLGQNAHSGLLAMQ